MAGYRRRNAPGSKLRITKAQENRDELYRERLAKASNSHQRLMVTASYLAAVVKANPELGESHADTFVAEMQRSADLIMSQKKQEQLTRKRKDRR